MDIEPNYLASFPSELWPCHPHPLEDELFSSWLLRLASHNHMKAHTAASLLFGKRVSLWNRDTDLVVKGEVLNQICLTTGTSFKRAYETTLQAYEGQIYEHHNGQGLNRWILSAGVYHRLKRRYGLMYCPLCLRDDKADAYYRRKWRLVFHVYCEKHNVFLLDACPKCDSPVMPFREELGQRSKQDIGSLSRCSNCGFDLCCAEPISGEVFDAELVQQLCRIQNFNGVDVCLPELPEIPFSVLFFDGLHLLLRVLNEKRRGSRLYDWVSTNVLGLQPDTSSFAALHWLRVSRRTRIMLIASWLLQDWPTRFVSTASMLGVSRSYILWGEPAPFWFYKVLDGELNFELYSPSRDEVVSASKYLTARGLVVNKRAIAKLLNVSGCKAIDDFS